jgi:hypothetical protein
MSGLFESNSSSIKFDSASRAVGYYIVRACFFTSRFDAIFFSLCVCTSVIVRSIATIVNLILGLNSINNKITIIDHEGATPYPLKSKTEVAKDIIDRLVAAMN